MSGWDNYVTVNTVKSLPSQAPLPVTVTIEQSIILPVALVDTLCGAVHAHREEGPGRRLLIPFGRFQRAELTWEGTIRSVGPERIYATGDLILIPEPCEATAAPEVLTDEL